MNQKGKSSLLTTDFMHSSVMARITLDNAPINQYYIPTLVSTYNVHREHIINLELDKFKEQLNDDSDNYNV